MKVDDQRDANKLFSGVEIGDPFLHNGAFYIRVEPGDSITVRGRDNHAPPVTAVNLTNGRIYPFEARDTVVAVDAKVVVG